MVGEGAHLGGGEACRVSTGWRGGAGEQGANRQTARPAETQRQVEGRGSEWQGQGSDVQGALALKIQDEKPGESVEVSSDLPTTRLGNHINL